MLVKLSKGEKVSLSKKYPSLKKIRIGLGWDTNKYDGEFDFDLDASAFLLKSDNKIGNERDFIFYNNLTHPTNCIVHTGDNRTGVGDGDDESIVVDFTKIPNDYEKLAITVTIHEAESRLQNFGMVENAYIRIVNEETDEELLRFDLSEDYSTQTALVFAELYKYNGGWSFKAVGSGYTGGLIALCSQYGINAE